MEIFSSQLCRILPVEWIQPTLTGNGTMGGSQMAVSRTFGVNNGAWGEAYTAFAPHWSDVGFYRNERKSSMYFCIYLPNPTKLYRITFYVHWVNSASGGAYNVLLYGGNSENDRRELLKNIGNIAEGRWCDTSISSPNYYKYFTLYLENGGWGGEDRLDIQNITLCGTYEDFV